MCRPEAAACRNAAETSAGVCTLDTYPSTPPIASCRLATSGSLPYATTVSSTGRFGSAAFFSCGRQLLAG